MTIFVYWQWPWNRLQWAGAMYCANIYAGSLTGSGAISWLFAATSLPAANCWTMLLKTNTNWQIDPSFFAAKMFKGPPSILSFSVKETFGWLDMLFLFVTLFLFFFFYNFFSYLHHHLFWIVGLGWDCRGLFPEQKFIDWALSPKLIWLSSLI